MVKQGNYASSSQLQHVRSFKQSAPAKAQRTIDETQLVEFIVVRYHLTQNARLTPIVKETMQRFLLSWLETAPLDAAVWPLAEITATVLAKTATKVPWQFYALVLGEWERFQKFLQKELPAVQMTQPKHLDGALTRAEFAHLVGEQLAVNWFLQTFSDNSDMLNRVSEAQIAEMRKSFIGADGHGDWANVAAVYDTTVLSMGDKADEPTRDWLTNLGELTVSQLN
ncbi:MAG: hypothetical protein LBT80_04940 [Lactobacillaceae bacterium]|jgi:hypothetical protein|nr:hypothetical protein [Lactobacillaceae bacterium]